MFNIDNIKSSVQNATAVLHVSPLDRQCFPPHLWMTLLYCQPSFSPLWLPVLLTLHLPARYYHWFLCQSPVWERDKQILAGLAISTTDLGGRRRAGARLGWASVSTEGQTLARTAETCFCQQRLGRKLITCHSGRYSNLISENQYL